MVFEGHWMKMLVSSAGNIIALQFISYIQLVWCEYKTKVFIKNLGWSFLYSIETDDRVTCFLLAELQGKNNDERCRTVHPIKFDTFLTYFSFMQ